MSHVDTMRLVCTSLSAAEKTAVDHGGILTKANTYKWYERHVGDYPLPEGVTLKDLGKCEYKITFPDCDYEVGLLPNPNGEGWIFIYDFWDKKLLQKIGGPKALKLQESLMVHQVTEASEEEELLWKVEEDEEVVEVYTYFN